MLCNLDPQPFYVHGRPRSEMLQIPDPLRRAGGVCTEDRDLALDHLDRLAAVRAFVGHLVTFLFAGTGLDDRSDHIWDDVARAFDQQPIPHTDVLFLDEIKVVQGRLFDVCAPHINWLQDRKWSDDARAPNVEADVEKLGGPLLGRQLECDSGSGIFSDYSQRIGQLQVVELDHHSIDLIGERVALAGKLLDDCDHFLDSLADPRVPFDRKSKIP